MCTISRLAPAGFYHKASSQATGGARPHPQRQGDALPASGLRAGASGRELQGRRRELGGEMSERMKRIVFSVPEQMRVTFIQVVRTDGRSQGEIIRSLIAQFIRETSQLQPHRR